MDVFGLSEQAWGLSGCFPRGTVSEDTVRLDGEIAVMEEITQNVMAMKKSGKRVMELVKKKKWVIAFVKKN